ncbi:MAG: HAD-IIB family hydrolase [Clostridia bacterium]|nr:HAD-IIB family hydrolase [Clostridia bacterium]
MGKFDGIFLVSDWDGTLCNGSNIPQENIDAIRYFQDEGGIFTVCSGRYYPYLQEFADEIKPNTHLITLNGAVIVDVRDMNFLHRGFLPCGYIEILDELLIKRGYYNSVTYYDAESCDSITFCARDYASYRNSLSEKDIYKILLVSDSGQNAISGVEYINSLGLTDIIAVRSWSVSTEILSAENTKGKALRRVAKAINAKLTVAVGDFENDISMLEEADVSYAVENAQQTVKNVADRITVNCNVGAISQIIKEIEQDIYG